MTAHTALNLDTIAAHADAALDVGVISDREWIERLPECATDVPALVAEVRRLRGALERIRDGDRFTPAEYQAARRTDLHDGQIIAYCALRGES
jgi:anti-sigma factor RsiW